MIYLILFFEFFKTGLFAIGGGLATLPFLQNMIEKYGWITEAELLNMIAISESTPGAIGINTATFVGNKTGGTLGGILASLGLITPSIIIILVIAYFFQKFNEKPEVQATFAGVRPAVTGLMASVALSVAQVALFNMDLYRESKNIFNIIELKSLVLFSIIFVLMRKVKTHPVVYIFIAGIIGIVLKF